MENSKFTRGRNNLRLRRRRHRLTIPLLLGAAVLSVIFMWPKPSVMNHAETMNLWEIRSVDTMKTSRDKARTKLHDSSYDTSINKQLGSIKSLGANYVALGTPYDNEFIPYLSRWVKLARKHELNVWFRGNFSRWEGWFDYPKDMTPAEHLAATAMFIEKNPGLFEDGDIFDPCPECENAMHWPQPDGDIAMNEFLRQQRRITEESFDKINKNVMTNIFSMIGGRARESMSAETAAALGGVVTIDHYIKNPSSMGEYVDYFASDLGAQTMVGETGAPIPDIHGDMSEDDQAAHVRSLLDELYSRKNKVFGLNYYVLSEGTTALINEDGSWRGAAHVLKRYYSPAVISGKITNTVGEPVYGVTVRTENGYSSAVSDRNGFYAFTVPSEPRQITYERDGYIPVTELYEIKNGGVLTKNQSMDPLEKNLIYKIKLFFRGG